jgi:hypothetical protein
MRLVELVAVSLVSLVPVCVGAQSPTADISGTWEAETPDGPQTVIVRSDSSASFGEETVRWKLLADTIYIEFGDEWVGYNFLLQGDLLTLSGGDLEEPVILKRIGPALPQGGGGSTELVKSPERFLNSERARSGPSL